ncbi:MAG TPA: hypothetical protein VNQ79_13360 [Blastocatellia bacterium]|nr:hypothetical protein [Blastocatellia bacterium]
MLKFVLVAEGKTDERVVPHLANRVLCEEGDDWIKDNFEDDPERLWKWIAIEEGTAYQYTSWVRIKQPGDSYKNGLRIYRRPGDGDRMAETRKAIALCQLLRKGDPPAALVLARDLDKKPDEHRRAMIQAREEARQKALEIPPIILATPNRVIEVWMLNGFVCENESEEQRLKSLRQKNSVDPCRNGHLLSADAAKESVSHLITSSEGEDRGRLEKCWAQTELEVLRKQGADSFLKEFLDEVSQYLLPLLTGRPDAI